MRTAGDLPSVLDGDVRKFKHEDLRIYADSLPAADPQPSSSARQGAARSEDEKKSPSEEVDTPWRTAKEAAEHARVSLWTIRQAVTDGDLPAYAVRTGRGYRLSIDEVDAWMRSRSWEPR
ncbi:MAG: excisionase family DNA-binding protein [Mycobacterium sp.]|nr:excisionase family DNA-binding protein [Mycobacterium sp.]